MANLENLNVHELIFRPSEKIISSDTSLSKYYDYDNSRIPLYDMRTTIDDIDFGIIICPFYESLTAFAINKSDRILNIKVTGDNDSNYTLTDMSLELIHFSRLMDSKLQIIASFPTIADQDKISSENYIYQRENFL